MKGLLQPEQIASLPAVSSWLSHAEMTPGQTPNQALQQTGAACRFSGLRNSPRDPGC